MLGNNRYRRLSLAEKKYFVRNTQMKKVFVASMFLGLASISQAAFVQCAPPQADVIAAGVGLSTAFTCNPGGSGASANVNSDGLAITQIRLRVSGTFQENAAPEGSVYSVLYTSSNNGATLATGSFTLGAVNCTATGIGSDANQALGACSQTSSFVAVTGLPDSIPGFTVTVTGTPGSIPLPFNASASVSYEVNTTPEVPEPATYAMMAAGLLSFYVARRRS
jgi:PEP-CTERM motif